MVDSRTNLLSTISRMLFGTAHTYIDMTFCSQEVTAGISLDGCDSKDFQDLGGRGRRLVVVENPACASLDEPYRENCNIDVNESGDEELAKSHIEAEATYTKIVSEQQATVYPPTAPPTMHSMGDASARMGSYMVITGTMIAAWML